MTGSIPELPAAGQSVILRGTPEQQALGRALAGLSSGSVVFLEGELGSGKTTLTQGLVAALGFADLVSSPTYALMNLYPTPTGQVLHVDAYRVRDPAELYEMDLDELIAGSRLSVIEWGERFYADYPAGLILRLEHLEDDPEARRLTRLR